MRQRSKYLNTHFRSIPKCGPFKSRLEQDPNYILNQLRFSNINKVIIGHLNINSLRNKFKMLMDIIKGNINILIVSETKIDDYFPLSQFCIHGYNKQFRLDRNSHRGGLVLIRGNIPCKQLFVPKIGIEAIFFEINLKKIKWLCCRGYNNHNRNISGYLKALEICLSVLDDYNAEEIDPHIKTLCETFKLKYLVKVPTFFKNLINPTCIDIIITNRVQSLQNTHSRNRSI